MLKIFQVLTACLMLAALTAQELHAADIEVSAPWARATPKGATVGGAYLSVRNSGSTPDRLIGGSVESAKRVEAHTMRMENGVMQMREVKGGFEIKPGETLELKPGGNHLMFMDLQRPLQAGEKVKGELRFEKAGSVPVEFEVRPLGGQAGHGH